MRPRYVAKTSIWSLLRIRTVLLWLVILALNVPLFMFGKELLVDKLNLGLVFWGIVGVLVLIPIIWFFVLFVQVKCRYTEFYKDKIVQHWGVFNKKDESDAFMGVVGVSRNRPFRGIILGYAHVHIDGAGNWDRDIMFVTRPGRLVRYLNTKTIKANEAGRFVQL